MLAVAVLTCFLLSNRRLSYAKIMQDECNVKTGKRSFTGLDTAEPKHFLCKEIANERKESLLYISRVQHFLCKDTDKIWFVTVQRQKIRVLKQ